MGTLKTFLVTAFFLSVNVCPAFAGDFYGASVSDTEVPSSFMRLGIYGQHPVVGSVASGSPAEGAGLASGDVILSVNGKGLAGSGEIAQASDDILTLRTFDGSKWKTLSFDRPALESAKQGEAPRRAAAAAGGAFARPPDAERPDLSPTVRFDDASLADTSLNIVDEPPESLAHTAPAAPTRDSLKDPSHDLEGIDW